MNRGSLVRILLTMALVGDGVGLATALSEKRTSFPITGCTLNSYWSSIIF